MGNCEVEQNRQTAEHGPPSADTTLPREGEGKHHSDGGRVPSEPSTLKTVSVVERYRVGDRRHPVRNDIIAALLIFALTTVNVLTNGSATGDRRAEVFYLLIAALAISVRRVVPYLALATGTGLLISLAFMPREGTADLVAYWSTMYTAGTVGSATLPFARSPKLGSVPGLRNTVRALSVLSIVATVVVGFFVGVFDNDPSLDIPEPSNPGVAYALIAILIAAFVASAWFIGDLVRVRRENDRELSARNAELVQQRAANEHRAVLNERVRISRELHDVVAHHVSLMGVQAGAARMALRQDPNRAEVALGEVERSSRQAVSELQRLLGFLRQDEPDTTAPQPTLSDLDALIADVERAGRTVHLDRTLPDDDQLPSSVQLTAFRIVQEALTNAVKHSTNAPIDLCVSADRFSLRVRIEDHGRPLQPMNGSAGHGLVGVRERVAFHGGTVTVSPLPSGFIIDAILPLIPSSAT